MKHTYKISNANNTIDFGYELIESEATSTTLEDIISNVSDAIIIYDTRKIIFNKILSKGWYLLNDSSKKFIAVVDPETLQSLTKNGVKNGFIRSTMNDSKLAVIVVDKERVYIIADENHIFETKPSITKEIFEYINHIIWTKTDFEVIQGSLPSQVNSIRLSVVKPEFQKVKSQEDIKGLSLIESTSDFEGKELLVSTLTENSKETHQIINGLGSVAVTKQDMFLNPFDNIYVPVEKSKTIYCAHSFRNQTLQSLLTKKVWIKDKIQPIQETKKVEVELYKPVDEYNTFKPDYKQFYDDKVNKYVCEINIVVDVKPMVIDKTYTISKRYEKIKNTLLSINQKIEDIKKLVPDDKENKNIHKQIEKVDKERNIINKVKLCNQLIEDIKIGDDALLNKKDKRYQSVNISESDVLVPSDLIGLLFEKQNNLYLAIDDEQSIENAKVWLKENKEKAVLVLKK